MTKVEDKVVKKRREKGKNKKIKNSSIKTKVGDGVATRREKGEK